MSGSGAAVSISVRLVGLKVEILTVSENVKTKTPLSMSMVNSRSSGRVVSLMYSDAIRPIHVRSVWRK